MCVKWPPTDAGRALVRRYLCGDDVHSSQEMLSLIGTIAAGQVDNLTTDLHVGTQAPRLVGKLSLFDILTSKQR